MRSAEALDILRALTKDGLEVNFPRDNLSETIRRDWPASFANIMPAPRQLVGKKSTLPARDIHLRGLEETIGNRSALDHTLATIKLSYHARWLLYLGAPEYEPAPKVSIVVPIYNRGWLVESLIENCLEQRYCPIEIVVVDDGSTDDTSARLATFADRIKLIRQPNGGVSAARNAGVLAATGELVQFLDSDNLLDAGYIEAKMRAFASIADADLCYCKPTDVSVFGVRSYFRPGQAYRLWDGGALPTLDLLDSIMAGGYPFLVSAVTLPRHVFHQHGGFETDLRWAEDERYWFRLALAGVKVIGLSSRLFYRCRMTDGLNKENRRNNDTMRGLLSTRDVVDLLRKPERWPFVAEYLAGYGAGRWLDLLDSEASIYGRDFDLLLEAVADLPRAGQSSNRSPLLLLLFLWMLGKYGRAPEIAIEPTSGRELLAGTLLPAIGRAAPLGQPDRNDWSSRGTQLRAKRWFEKIVSVSALPTLPDEGQAKIAEAIAFLRGIANVVSDGETGTGGETRKKKRKKRRPQATIVVPVLADPKAAEATVVSCLRQTVVNRIEIILVDNEPARTALWSERYPQAHVITFPRADSVVEAHFAGLTAAQSRRIRFLLPGDILEPAAVERQIETSREFNEDVAVVEMPRPKGLRRIARLLPIPGNSSIQPAFSAILFPRSVLLKVGGFDLALGDGYQDRYLFRLMAAGVPRKFVDGTSSLLCRKPPAGSADQIVIAALANLIQCLGNPQLWHYIPVVARPLSAVEISAVEGAELRCLTTRVLDFTLKMISELSSHAASRSPLVPFALCLIGLERGLPPAGQRAPQRDILRSAILEGATNMPLDMSSELSITHLLAETNDDPAFAKAVETVSAALDGRPQYAGLRDLLRLFVPDRSRWRFRATSDS